MITTKTKVIILVVILIIAIGFYIYYINKNKPQDIDIKPQSNKEFLQKMLDAAKTDSQNTKIFLYSKKTDKLYLKDTDGKIYDGGYSADCPFIFNNKNISVFEISDIINIYNCASMNLIPDEYKNRCGATDSSKFFSVVLKTADEYEKYLQDSVVGTFTPNADVCYSTDPTNGPNNSNNTFLQYFGKKFRNIEEYLASRKDEIIKFAQQFGVIVAASKFIGHFAVIYFILPQFFSGNKIEMIKAGLMTGQILFQWVMSKLVEFSAAMAAGGAEKFISDSLFESVSRWAVEASAVISKEAFEMTATILSDGINPILELVAVIQLIGMIIDTVDPCGLTSENANLTQAILNTYRDAIDKTVFVKTGGETYPTVFDPTLICDYNLDCNYVYNNCLTADQKAGKSIDDYCKTDNDKYQQYMNEYLSNLKVNSVGQCIGDISNAKLRKLFEQYVGGGIDWSPIEQITKKDISLPDNKTLQSLDLLLVDDNVIAASYVNKYWYLFLSFFILVLIVLFML